MYYGEMLRLPKGYINYIKSDLEVDNPEYLQLLKMGYSTKDKKAKLKFYVEHKDYIEVPRMYRNIAIPIDEQLKDFTVWNNPKAHLEFSSGMSLWDNQRDALDIIIDSNGNKVIEMPTGSGKTVAGIAAICYFKRRTLVIAPTVFLADQWKAAAEIFCNAKVGRLYSKKMEIGDQYDIVVTIPQNIQPVHEKRFKQLEAADFFNGFDVVIVDEAHRFSAITFNGCISKFPSKVRLGFTATAFRNDNLGFVFNMAIGEAVSIDVEQKIKPKIWECYTTWTDRAHGFSNNKRKNKNIPMLITRMTQDKYRNMQLYHCLLTMAKNDRRVLFLTGRVDHAKKMLKYLKAKYPKKEYCLLIGSSSEEERAKSKTADFIFGSYQIAQEGIDIPLLDTIIYGTPISNEIGIIQSIGRLTREKEGKKGADVYDFIDDTDTLKGMFYKRRRTYSKMGLEYSRINMKKLGWR